jgi:hypothetical protein
MPSLMARSPASTNNGCSQFNPLLFHRGEPTFCAFDLLTLNGRDLRSQPLIERKRRLRDILPECPQLFFVDCVQEQGERLFELVCARDLEGIVAKHRSSQYTVENGNPAWIKIRNRGYSQMIGRDELFERRYEAIGAPEIGWNACEGSPPMRIEALPKGTATHSRPTYSPSSVGDCCKALCSKSQRFSSLPVLRF